jgi:nucleoside-diphosphate-sugar epimerase
LAYDYNGHRITDALIQRARERQAGPHIGSGTSRWSTIHLEDLADLYVLALGKGSPDTLFHAARVDIGMSELAECIARRLGLDRTEPWSIEDAQKSLAAAPQLAENMLI